MRINLKTSWEQVTIEDYMKIYSIIGDENINEVEKEIMILAVLAGVNEHQLNKFPLSEIKRLFSMIGFIHELPKGDIQDYYFIGGKRYKLVKNPGDMTAGQFIDINSYTKDADLMIENIHLIAATLLLPAPFEPAQPLKRWQKFFNWLLRKTKGTWYHSYCTKKGLIPYTTDIKNLPVEEYGATSQVETAENFFKYMTIDQAMGISFFFVLLSMSYTKVMQDYLGSEVKNQLKLVSTSLKTQKEKEIMKKITELSNLDFIKSMDGLQQ